MSQVQPLFILSQASVWHQRGRLLLGTAGVAVILLAVFAPRLVWPALLMSGMYVLGLALGSMFFLALQRVCYARWSRSFELLPRAIARTLPWTLWVLVPVLTLGLPTLYEWSHAGEGHNHDPHHALHGFKAAWLSTGFFWLRAAFYLVVWILFARLLSRRPRHERDMVGVSAGFIVLFSLTFVPASFDWIMSIDAHWFSTIFGVYHFAGAFLSALAFITLLVVLLPRTGMRAAEANPDQLHDLGRLIFAFSSFWAYIWFSQYMLIWYSNLPEETGYYLLRHSGVWATVSFFNVILNWVVPFIVLLSASAKRNANTLLAVCIVLMVGRCFDLAFMILPPFAGSWSAGLLLGTLATAGGLCLFAARVIRTAQAGGD